MSSIFFRRKTNKRYFVISLILIIFSLLQLSILSMRYDKFRISNIPKYFICEDSCMTTTTTSPNTLLNNKQSVNELTELTTPSPTTPKQTNRENVGRTILNDNLWKNEEHLIRFGKNVRINLPISILMWTTRFGGTILRDFWRDDNCNKNCFFANNRTLEEEADVIVFHDLHQKDFWWPKRRPNQIWTLWRVESPLKWGKIHSLPPNTFNFTMTYSRRSDVIATYGEYKEREEIDKTFERTLSQQFKQRINNGLVMMSNCKSPRINYINELKRYFDVHSFGRCFQQSYTKNIQKNTYKFYLALENSQCEDYVTEKLWVNSFQNYLIPIVKGPKKSSYEKIAPPNSFIHLDDFYSTKELASFLSKVSSNITLYRSFHEWRIHYVSRPISWGKQLCRLCQTLLASPTVEQKVYKNVSEWMNECHPYEYPF
ncbi:hypothetical protein SNEBB_001661 [Seison nebaliae]|nr:hypothetical protein SNEBB_001661 [Seison nebaliae]